MANSAPIGETGAVPSLEEPNPPPADAMMPDAHPPPSTSASMAPRTSTPQRNGTVPPGPEPAFPTMATPHGARCRQYLNEKVTPALLAGMKHVASEQPENPLRMLGEYLIAKSTELEGTDAAGGAAGK